MSSFIRPSLRFSSVPKFTPRIPQHIRSRRTFADYPKPPDPSKEVRRGVVAPKTRIAVGIVFIGAMIYSMVTSVQVTMALGIVY
jgi:coproporphyrinogen III oxidase